MKKLIAAACLALAVGAIVLPGTASADNKRPLWSNDGWYTMPWNQPQPGWNQWNQVQPGWKQPQFGWNGGWGQPWGPSWGNQWNDNRCWSNDWRCKQSWKHDDHDRFVSPKVVTKQLKSYGYRKVIDIDRDGDIYKVKAIDDRGRLVGLVFDAESGRLIKRKFVND